MSAFCLREAARAKNGPVYLLQLVLTKICFEMSKVSPLLLQVYTTYRCLHLTPIKEKEHPEEFYPVFGLGLSKDVHRTYAGV